MYIINMLILYQSLPRPECGSCQQFFSISADGTADKISKSFVLFNLNNIPVNLLIVFHGPAYTI